MRQHIIILILVWAITFMVAVSGHCLTNRDIDLLRRNGIGIETITLLIREKSVETGAFTVEEVVRLKKSGLSEKNIRTLIREAGGGDRPDTVVYGKSTLKQRVPSAEEIVALKKAGVSDDVIQAMIVTSAINRANPDVERAWQMLYQMDLRVDQR